MFDSDNKKLSANYNLIWANMRERVIQAFISLYGEQYESYIRNVINNVRFVHVEKNNKEVVQDRFLELYTTIRNTFLKYQVITPDTPVKEVLEVATKYVKDQFLAYYIDGNTEAYDQLVNGILECSYYYTAAKNNEVVTYGNPNGTIKLTFNGYQIPLEELFYEINSKFCYLDRTDTLRGIFNNLFAREMVDTFVAYSNNVETVISLEHIRKYDYIYCSLYNVDQSIIDNIYQFYRDYLRQLFINNKYDDFISFFEKDQYNSINNYLNDCIEKISYQIYTNPNTDLRYALTDDERNKGISLLNSIYSRLSLKTLKKITN